MVVAVAMVLLFLEVELHRRHPELTPLHLSIRICRQHRRHHTNNLLCVCLRRRCLSIVLLLLLLLLHKPERSTRQ